MNEKTITVALLLSLFGQPAVAQQIVPEPGEVPRSDRALVEPGELRPVVASGSGTGWKVAFWITAAATAGLATASGVAGASMVGLEDDKFDLIVAYRQRHNDPWAFSGEDVCVEAEARGDAGEITALCEDGKDRVVKTYVLLGLTMAGALASSLLLYRAYFYSPSSQSVDQDHEGSSPESSPARWMIAPSVGAHGGGLGFVMRF